MKLRRVRISIYTLTSFLTENKEVHFKVSKGLPEGAVFHYCFHDAWNTINAVYEHDSFIDLNEGDEIPEHSLIELEKL